MSDQKRVLVVDDEPDICELLEITLGRMGLQTQAASDLAEARRLLGEAPFDLCLTDMRLPDGSGIELVQEITSREKSPPVAVITAHGSMETAIQALKAGAFDFVSKPVDLQVLRKLVGNALRLADTPSVAEGSERSDGDTLLGDSPVIEHIRQLIRKLARSQAPVYISGESGTGKELAARLIHRQGPRKEAEFVAVNCGAIPQELMESEFFGHRKGSFTGAVADKPGLFDTAHGGTLFLDEVADLPLHMQVKLLRAIQEKSIRPVGSQKEHTVDVRIVSATHKNLPDLVSAGEFRQDLFYRINVIELAMPPLRARAGDIAPLARHILGRLGLRMGIPSLAISEEALAALQRQPFPGNVRELENLLERAATLCENDCIELADLMLQQLPTLAPSECETGGPVPTQLPDALKEDGLSFDEQMEQVERLLITRALEAEKGNRTAAAKRLGMTFRSFRYRLGKLNIDPD